MRKHLWFSLIASLFVQGAMGQTTDGSAARHEKTVEENLRHLAVIKGRPHPGMLLADQMLRLHVPGVSIAVIHDKRIDWSKGYLTNYTSRVLQVISTRNFQPAGKRAERR